MAKAWQQKTPADVYWRLFPMLLIAAALVIVLSALSVVALNAMMRSTQSNTVQRPEQRSDGLPPALPPPSIQSTLVGH